MPQLTPKLGIKKPLGNETVSRAAFNENWDIIDENAASQADFDTHKNATTGVHGATSEITPNAIIQRDSAGRAKVAAPAAADDIARKAETDAALNAAAQAEANAKSYADATFLTKTGAEKINITGPAPIEISNGTITVTQTFHVIDTEGGAASDELTHIYGGNSGDILILRSASSNRPITIREGVGGAGTIYTFDRSDIVLNQSVSMLPLIKMGDYWYTISNVGIKRTGDAMAGPLTVPNLIATVNIPSSSGPSAWPRGFAAGIVYNNGYPVSYGTIFSYKGTSGNSCVQILQTWPNTDGGDSQLFIRAARDVGTDVFGPWRRVWSENNNPQLRVNNGALEFLDEGVWKGVGGVRKVQRGYTQMPLADELNISISSVNLNKSFITLSHITDSGTVSQSLVAGYLTSSTNLRIVRLGSWALMRIAWEVVEGY